MSTRWPVTLHDSEQDLLLRPLRHRDAVAWREVRRTNHAWLGPWDATPPPGSGDQPTSYGQMVRGLNRAARQGRALPLAVVHEGRFVGQVTVSNIVWGSARFGNVGYWIDQRVAGRGLMPLAVAMVMDHCFTVVGLHRLEVAIRAENSASLRVAEKLDLPEIGFAPRYLHIDGAWRDHRVFALTTEQVPEGGMVARVRRDALA